MKWKRFAKSDEEGSDNKEENKEEKKKKDDADKRMLCESCDANIQLSIDMGESVVPLPSAIPQGGLGLFALKSFRAGEYITDYGGELISPDDPTKIMESELRTSHFMKLARGYAINGSLHYSGKSALKGILCRRGLAQFMNTWRVNQADECNVKWEKDPVALRVKAVAKSSIEAGEELFADYVMCKVHPTSHNKEKKKKKKKKGYQPYGFNEDYLNSRLRDPMRSGRSRK